MKHIRTYEKYRIVKNRSEIIKEAVLQVNDIYKVKTMIDIPQSLINSYVKKVKETKIKVQTAIQGDKLRVSGKKRDDLQSVMSVLKELNLGIPLQYNNFRD